MMLPKHHPGVYGLNHRDRWSCCCQTLREAGGCHAAVGTMKAMAEYVGKCGHKSAVMHT